MVIISTGIVVHRAIAAILMLADLAHVRSVVRVGVVRISVAVAMARLATRNMLG